MFHVIYILFIYVIYIHKSEWHLCVLMTFVALVKWSTRRERSTSFCSLQTEKENCITKMVRNKIWMQKFRDKLQKQQLFHKHWSSSRLRADGFLQGSKQYFIQLCNIRAPSWASYYLFMCTFEYHLSIKTDYATSRIKILWVCHCCILNV